MRDLYELCNEVNLKEDELLEMDVTALEKARLKQSLKQAIHSAKPRSSWKKRALAAAMVGALSLTALGLTFPTYASSLPVIRDIFKMWNDGSTGPGVYDHYKEYSTALNLSQTSKGISVTMQDAIYDGQTVSVAFAIESEQDLGENPTIQGSPVLAGATAMSGSSRITRIDDHHYVGLYHATGLAGDKGAAVNVDWELNRIIVHETSKEIKGNWSFELSLKATEGRTQLIGQSTEQAGVRVNLDKITVHPMSFTVHYSQQVGQEPRSKWDDAEVVLDITDDLGNHYTGKTNGGTGQDDLTMKWSTTFSRLDAKAARLIVTPRVILRSYSAENHGSVELDGNDAKTSPEPGKSEGRTEEIRLKDLVIDLQD
ncbi:DUF4179 domain-containing protein [Paenibacillus albidus]|uniref:DUF4179 domain-containing protein n=1 Tax=Paenibacillus albidus TaxID=2041023 RepID=UPI001BEC6E26|nr:DUF4179 domain-containing protein [Paenibacillus albidus]MBT2293462.1 DUF4179 domain-containing protein [Paenibacillus albidus]